MSWSDLRRWSTVGLLALAILTASCGLLTEPRESHGLVHEVVPPHLILTNKSDKPTFYFVVEQDLLPRINWYACTNVAVCPPLAPGESVHIEFEQIIGYNAGSEFAVLCWWDAEGARDGAQSFERVRGTAVKLR